MQRPIVGHHMSLDILYIYNNFIEELPNSYLEFLQKVNTYLPHLFDNKVLSTQLRIYIKKLPNYTEGLY